MPIEQHRERIGQFTNKSQRYITDNEQRRNLNLLAQSFGHYPVGRGVWSSTGILYLLSIGQNLRISDTNLPNRQRAVQETTAAFEVDTFVGARQQGAEITLDSLLSSSTANPQRFIPIMVNNAPIPTSSFIDAALRFESAHLFSRKGPSMEHWDAQNGASNGASRKLYDYE